MPLRLPKDADTLAEPENDSFILPVKVTRDVTLGMVLDDTVIQGDADDVDELELLTDTDTLALSMSEDVNNPELL